MSALTWLLVWCTSGGVVGWMMGARIGRSRVGLLLGALMGVFGWVLMLAAEPPAGSAILRPSLSTAVWNRITRVAPADSPASNAVIVEPL